MMHHTTVGTYWWRGVPNFGDLLGPALLTHFGYKPIWRDVAQAQLITIGSVLSWTPPTFRGTILGAGLMCRKQHHLPVAQIVALRGPYTRDLLGAPSDTVLGDFGLLADQLAPPLRPEFTLGLIPHFIDRRLAQQFAEGHQTDVLLIDVQQSPAAVLTEMARCAAIVSSSLHGLIAADSLGLPNVWLWSDGVAGNGFKFDDYYAAFGVERQPIALTTITEVLAAVRLLDTGEVKAKLMDVLDSI